MATHTNDEWTEQVALEHLAVLSVVARWADETELVKLPSLVSIASEKALSVRARRRTVRLVRKPHLGA